MCSGKVYTWLNKGVSVYFNKEFIYLFIYIFEISNTRLISMKNMLKNSNMSYSSINLG
jgi:hypothetical protein